jgi:hypothetical protein
MKVAKEVAEQEFERMCSARGVLLDGEDLDDSDRETLAMLRKRIVGAICRGELVVTPEGDPVFTPPSMGKSFTFHPPTGATLMAMGNESDNSHVRLNKALGEMTRSPAGEFSKMALPDYRICQAMANLFLADR